MPCAAVSDRGPPGEHRPNSLHTTMHASPVRKCTQALLTPKCVKCCESSSHCVDFPARSTPSNTIRAPRDGLLVIELESRAPARRTRSAGRQDKLARARVPGINIASRNGLRPGPESPASKGTRCRPLRTGPIQDSKNGIRFRGIVRARGVAHPPSAPAT